MPIRAANEHDAEALWELRHQAIVVGCRGHYSPAVLSRWSEGVMPPGFEQMVSGAFYLLEQHDEILACGMLDIPNRKIEALFVRPNTMGKGYGRLMLQHLEQLAVTCNIRQLSLESSLNAVLFYQRCGWQSLGHSRYHSPKGIILDCVLMAKTL
ncbi:GNAT family N-acetyltransferase [Shewanella dokdonensis]|uniref:GNAT family N-acetyltransferase n=1 Tax=Shewanella dokdonensis TaxID=712036 RepID=A0ABX8DJ92_9GAMM|nr:GNAT family N-acetyltransferase [Shewanella dokdonensis]MCL1074295.1 GNAT family N-acetyltransferase [Shewanella dokdonensis]QVK23997.1 GNAT family N-acetyltransferase [Shewanella dokdonensis]